MIDLLKWTGIVCALLFAERLAMDYVTAEGTVAVAILIAGLVLSRRA